MKTTYTYRLIKSIGIYLSPDKYGNLSISMFIYKAIRLWKNEVFQNIARNSVLISPAPLSARLIRPMLHRWRGVKIGKDVFIGLDVIFDSVYPEMISIGNGCILTNRVNILAHNRDLQNYQPGIKIKDTGYIVSKVIIKNDVVIGVGSIILPGVTIGEGAVVAAGSLVNKDVKPYTMVAGVPAKIIKKFTT